MSTRNLILIALVALSALAVSCGGSSTTGIDNPQISPGHLQAVTAPLSGPGFTQLPADNFDLGNPDKESSNSYRKFFSDSVNAQSTGRWTVTNNSGAKQWTLSNTAASAPKSWLMGGNYWNHESDTLVSNAFTVPDGTNGIALTFYARWKIAFLDMGEVDLYVDGVPTPGVQFSGGQNPDYPGWTKYYFQLPANTSGADQTWNVGFDLFSDAAGTDFGLGIDNVAVYQTQLNPPLALSASDGLPGGVTITWSDNNAGNLIPDSYEVWRGDSPGGPYSTLVGTVNYGDPNSVFDATAPFLFYYYVAKAKKAGWPDSAYSNEDLGFGM